MYNPNTEVENLSVATYVQLLITANPAALVQPGDTVDSIV